MLHFNELPTFYVQLIKRFVVKMHCRMLLIGDVSPCPQGLLKVQNEVLVVVLVLEEKSRSWSWSLALKSLLTSLLLIVYLRYNGHKVDGIMLLCVCLLYMDDVKCNYIFIHVLVVVVVNLS